jgi:hypothetical protein
VIFAMGSLFWRISFLSLCCIFQIGTEAFAHHVDPSSRAVTPHAVTTGKKRGTRDPLLQSANASIYTTAIRIAGSFRFITSDGLPDEPHGKFPNRGNPNVIAEQRYELRVPVEPIELPQSIPNMPHLFGIALDGIPFDPGTAEFWRGDPRSGWHGEALTAPPPRLGIDVNNAHVQPSGAYHYHGLPTGLLNRLDANTKQVLIGWAADGYPIYGPMCADDSGRVRAMKPSWRLKSGNRPGGNASPAGAYDGRFTEDFEYVAGLGDLDECNGRFGKTAEFPQSTYYYVITDGFPYVPRRWHGQPDRSFFKHPPPPPGGRPPF